MIVVDFIPSDYRVIVSQSKLSSVVDISEPDRTIEAFMSGPAYTAKKEDIIIGAAGIMPMTKGVGSAWLLATPYINNYPLETARTVRRIFKGLSIKMRLHRVQTVALQDSSLDCRWLEWLGFQRECMMEAYGPNKENFYLYRKLFGV